MKSTKQQPDGSRNRIFFQFTLLLYNFSNLANQRIKTKKLIKKIDNFPHQLDNTGFLSPPAMAIASVAAEYVFSDFLLKGPEEAKYAGIRLELPPDKIVTFLAVGLPLFLISLGFAQEVSVGEWPERQLSDGLFTHKHYFY